MKKGIFGILSGTLLFIGTTFSVAADNHVDRDCGEFANHEEVMAFWYENGYNADNDPHDLDRDNDGLACEVSQSEYDNYVASQENDDSEEAVEENEEEGAALPDTASNGPLMMLFGAGIAGAGSLLLFRRKNRMA
ncbi:Surface protein from Gram-positive cocci, anchor region [Planococcus halocryophilus Or1]|uniref:Cell surface protein n=1 Tax=Planococcus halocryophilus TaxID=1215089 RepID=A0A1C7DUY7_9BACL|nr:excalibur calcium-binding domain-containing protein [Planococcus halocryophilus]ANU15224.1 cell surface protein [Planococcus halocryophilus]EMF46975.1 Surface protein from Gram-positive cocci, anchor region [Planococcus halocryophilus Or1]